MQVVCFQRLEELDELEIAWDALAGNQIFRSWTWTTAWWQHYGLAVGARSQRRELRVVAAFSDDRPTAILPCYMETCWARGRVWRLCGDGEVCSDHLGLLADPKHADEAVQAIANYFVDRDDWDLLDFAAVDVVDASTRALGTALRESGCSINEFPAPRVWRIELPDTWDDYLAMLSKSHRKKLRRLEKNALRSGEMQWRVAETADEFQSGWEVFRDLHTRRWERLGHAGCFAMPRWRAFHEEVAPRLLQQKHLRLAWLQHDNQPLAAEYQFVAGATVFAYQGGIDPDALDAHPGRISHICGVQQALAEGQHVFDFLRGDETYKQNYRAEPQLVINLQATPQRFAARWRQQAYHAAQTAGRAAKRFAGLFS